MLIPYDFSDNYLEYNIRIFKNFFIGTVLVNNMAPSGKKQFTLIPWMP
jgi:hypothetical protein